MTEQTERDRAARGETVQGSSNPSEQAPEQGDRPVHLYDAVATQRDHVLKSYDTQRSAIMQAVAEQREAAVAPIRSVQQRQIARESGSATAKTLEQQTAGMPPGASVLPPQRPNASAVFTRQQLVAADIAATLRAMIAEEVRRQFRDLLAVVDKRVAERADARDDVAPPPPGDGNCAGG